MDKVQAFLKTEGLNLPLHGSECARYNLHNRRRSAVEQADIRKAAYGQSTFSASSLSLAPSGIIPRSSSYSGTNPLKFSKKQLKVGEQANTISKLFFN